MSDDIVIRGATEADSPSLRNLMTQLCEAQKVPYNEKRFIWGIKKRLYDRLQKQGLLVAEDSETSKILGMVFAELIIDPTGTAEGYIRTVIVDKKARGRKVGSRLLKYSINYLKDLGVEIIRVNSTEKQEEYYQSFGFKNKYSVMELRP